MTQMTQISDCTCRGINLLKEISDFYISTTRAHEKGLRPTKKHYEDAKRLSNELYARMTTKVYENDIDPVEPIRNNKRLRQTLDSCNEQGGSDCAFALDHLRQYLHQHKEPRDKLLCGHRSPTLNEDDVRRLVGILFSAEFYSERYHPFKKYIDRDIREECDKRKIK